MHIVIVTGGIVHKKSAIQNILLNEADYIIAADSGAETLLSFNKQPNVVIGDFDSISPSIRQQLMVQGTPFITYPQEKDQTDTELSIEEAIKHGATAITIIGGIAGDRLDHILGNILLMSRYNIPIIAFDGLTKAWSLKGPQELTIKGKRDDILSLIPLSPIVENIKTRGLYYPLNNEKLIFGKPQGISNVFTEEKATISFSSGILSLIHISQH